MKKLLVCLLLGVSVLTGCGQVEEPRSVEEAKNDFVVGAHALAEFDLLNDNPYYNGEELYSLSVEVEEFEGEKYIRYIAYDINNEIIGCASINADWAEREYKEAME